ncbi:hypothetical protein [Ideonella sp.]
MWPCFQQPPNRINSLTVNGAGQTVAHNAQGAMTQRGTLVMNWDA